MAAPIIILNPTASRLRDPKRRAEVRSAAIDGVRRRLDLTPEVFESTELADVRRVVRKAAADAVPLVVAAGGDGTVMEVVSDLAGSGIPVAIAPSGTGNILATTLASPATRSRPCRRLPDAELRTIDLGQASWATDGVARRPEPSPSEPGWALTRA